MNREEWQNLDKAFHAALEERDPGRRAAYVAEVSAGNESARHELEAMLAHYDLAESFMESPAYVLATETFLDEDSVESLIDKTVGDYQILSLLGSGGMGVVYLAFDQELHRKVALKFLHDDLLSDQQRLQRFKHEARAASALNHPNIITIYQIGEVSGRQFIATEFVPGQTLRHLIKRTRLSLEQSLDIAVQVASALSAAHAANIMHRDIKPENVMVRADGYVKVLDFGLAKLIEGPNFGSETSSLLNTEQGMIVGTVQYMSPEQARGQAVDARTDVWSLGVLLYEMLTRNAPFGGETRSDVIAAILEREPLPLMRFRPTLPKELQALVSKSLEKDREQRYQSANEMLGELQVLKQKVDVQIPSGGFAATGPLNQRTGAESDAQPEAKTLAIFPAGRTMGAEYVIGKIRRLPTGLAVGLLILVIAVTAITVGYFGLSRRKSQSYPLSMKMTRFTTRDQVHGAAISPDAKSVAYVVNESGLFLQSIRRRQIDTTSDIQIDAPSPLYHQRLIFSPDGNYLYFTDGADNLYRMPSLGGPKSKLMAAVSSPLSFSPDGKRITFLRRAYPTQEETSLMTANADGTGEQKIASRRNPDFFDGAPSWSPKTPSIACGAGGVDERGPYMTVVEVQLEGGALKEITSKRWSNVGPVVWLSDGSGLLMLAEDLSTIFSPQIWQLSYPDGSAHRVTNELNSYDNLSLSTDSSMALTEQTAQPASIWIQKKAGPTYEISPGFKGSYENPAWLSDGELIYDSTNSGQWDIWRLDVKQGIRAQLTMNAGVNGDSSLSADGRYIVFASNRGGALNIWRMDADGANPKQLTSGNYEDDYPHLTPDGKWVVYESTRGGTTTLWKVSFDGGNPVQMVDKPAHNAAISPDGKWVFYQSTYPGEPNSFSMSRDGKWIPQEYKGETTLWKIPIDGGRAAPLVIRNNASPIIARYGNLIDPVVSPDGKLIACRYQPDTSQDTWKVAIFSLAGLPFQLFDIPTHPLWDKPGLRWSPDGRSITYRVHKLGFSRNGIDNLWSQPMDGGAPKQLTNFDSYQIFNFAWSRNGDLAVSRGVETREVVLLSNFR